MFSATPEPVPGYRIEITRRAETDVATLTPKLKRKLKDILLNQIAVAPHRGKKLVVRASRSYP